MSGQVVIKSKMAGLDPRTKLMFVVVLGILSFMSSGMPELIWNYLVTLVILLGSRDIRAILKAAAAFVLVMGLDLAVVKFIPDGILEHTLSMFLFMIQRLLPMLLLAGWLSAGIRINDFVTAMQNMRIPKGFTITLAVALRFIPTVKYEFRSIKNTMKLRGVGFTFKNIATKPVRTMEYALIPLVLRSMKIADELAASTLTRGLDRDTGRTSLRDVRLRIQDLVAASFFLGAMFLGHWASGLLSEGVL